MGVSMAKCRHAVNNYEIGSKLAENSHIEHGLNFGGTVTGAIVPDGSVVE